MRPGQRRRVVAALSVTVLALLTLLPTGAASAKSIAGTASPQLGPAGVTASMVDIPTGNLTPILAGLPVGDLGLSNAAIGTLLGELDGGVLGGETGLLTSLVGTLLSENPTATLAELTGAVQEDPILGLILAFAGKELTPEGIVAELTPEEISTVLGNFTAGANAGQIEAVLASLTEGPVSGEQLTALQTVLGALGGGLSGEGLTKLREDLGGLPTGLSPEELALLGPAGLGEVVAGLFGTASPTQLAPVVADLLGSLTWGAGTTGSLAEGLGVPVETLAGALGESTEGGFSNLPTMTSALGSTGDVVGLVDRARGLALGVLGPEDEGEEGGGEEGAGGGSGGEGGSGGSGGGAGEGSGGGGSSGGSGGSGAGGSGGGAGNGGSGGAGAGGLPGGGVTLTITLPPASTPAFATTRESPKPTKIKVISHRVRGRFARIVLQAPSAGTLKLSGPGVRTTTARLRNGGRVTLTATLPLARLAALQRGHRHLRVRLKATFKPASGPSSSATATVTFA